MIVTVPMAGYVSADKAPSGDVNQTPDYLNARFLESRAAKRRGFSYPPDTGDRVVYQDEFVAWLESAFPDARRDPARTLFYSLDNEPDLWASTHARIRPTGKVTYAELVQRTEEWAAAIKAVAPGALVFGPVSYGWQGFVRLQDAPDHGGRDFLDFYLDAMRDAEGRARRRLVDVLDLHWYPEAQGRRRAHHRGQQRRRRWRRRGCRRPARSGTPPTPRTAGSRSTPASARSASSRA